MTRPRAFTLAGHKWREVVADLSEDGLWGECVYARRLVRIDRSARGAMRRETRIHERLHAVCNQAGIDLSEAKIQAIASGLAEALAHDLKRGF